MSILKSQTKVQQLQKKSADALGIFQNTVNNLADTNAQIQQEKAIKIEQIAKLKQEQSDLESLENQNQTVMSKIEDFLFSITE